MPHPVKVALVVYAWRALRVVVVVALVLAAFYFAAWCAAFDAAYWRALDGGPP